jgi:ribose transport system ATP-binding protein
VTLAVRKGEVHGLVGENGAGKSTLMGVASGALVANEGQVTLLGQPVGGDPERVRDLPGYRPAGAAAVAGPDGGGKRLAGPARGPGPYRRDAALCVGALTAWSDDTGIDVNDRVETLNPESASSSRSSRHWPVR